MNPACLLMELVCEDVCKKDKFCQKYRVDKNMDNNTRTVHQPLPKLFWDKSVQLKFFPVVISGPV